MRMASRLDAMVTNHYEGLTEKVNGKPVWTGKVAQAPDKTLHQPLHWKKPRRIFVNSMGDLFHENVPDEWIDRVFAVMALCPQHTFMILTKRAGRMQEYCNDPDAPFRVARAMSAVHAKMTTDRRGNEQVRKVNGETGKQWVVSTPVDWPLRQCWLGVSAEDQKRADERIPDLLATPAAVRFVSIEPQLGPIKLWDVPGLIKSCITGVNVTNETAEPFEFAEVYSELDWCINGAESGYGARPFDDDWARSLRDQCKTTGTAFFFKQHIKNGKKIETPELDGRRWMEYPK